MTKAIVLLSLGTLLLGGCASPSPRMASAERGELQRDGLTYTVFHDGARAEVIRTGLVAFGESGQQQQMISAVQEITGCDIVPGSVSGDISLLRMELNCSE